MKKTEEKTIENCELVELGTIGKAIGIDGKMRLNIYSDSERNISPGKEVLIEGSGGRVQLTVSSAKMKNGYTVVMFKEIKNRTEASALTGKKLYISDSDMDELREDEIYVRDLIGMTVYDRKSEKQIGIIKDVMTNRVQPIYVIESPEGKEVLIPGVSEFVKKVDEYNKEVEVELIPGFI